MYKHKQLMQSMQRNKVNTWKSCFSSCSIREENNAEKIDMHKEKWGDAGNHVTTVHRDDTIHV